MLLLPKLIEYCDLCQSKVSENTMVLAKGKVNKGEVNTKVHIVMCRRCKYIFQRERFDSATLSHLYKEDNGYDPQPELKRKVPFLRNKRKRQMFVSYAIDLAGLFHAEKFNLLDVGGGVGDMTEHLVDQCNVYLVDVNTSPPIHPKIVKINKLFEQVDIQDQFGVILMNHVLEHVFSPTQFLRKAHELLDSQGIVIIEVPFELYTPLLFKRIGDWRHVAYFSSSVLRNFLHKTGFEPLFLKLSTGYYHDRRLTVIRAVARKVEESNSQGEYNSSYFGLLRDGTNIKALTNYFMLQLSKIMK